MGRIKEYVYAIVRKKDSKQLELVSEPAVIFYTVDSSILCKYYEYASDLRAAHSSELVAISPRILENSCEQINARLRAYAFEQALQKVLSTYDVVAYSHRRGGWRNILWEYNKDISFVISTNFGYGNDSYFHVLYKYKDVLLSPYADYVKYRNSTVGDILKFTKSYRLEYEEWEYLLKSTLDFYNAVVNKEEHYIIEWVNDHLKYLIEGLRSFVVKSEMGFTIGSYEHTMKISTKATVSHDDFWVLKSSKIANALDFIENFKILPAEFGGMNYVQPIIDVCKDFYPLLLQKIEQIKGELEHQENKHTEIIGADLFILYRKLYNKYYYKYRLFMKSNISLCLFFIRGLQRLHKQYDIQEIRSNLKELKILIDIESKTSRRISELKAIHESLSKDAEKIKLFFQKETTIV